MNVLSSSFVPDPDHRFIGLPIQVCYIDGIEWRLERNVGYRTLADETTTVRAPFRFDFASIPRPLYWLFPPAGDGKNLYGVAAIWHDWLYCHRKIGGRVINRAEADAIFLEIMQYLQVSRTVARIMYRMVRMFGWIPWRKRKKEDII